MERQNFIESIKNDELVKKFIELSDQHLNVLGYTEHGFRHVNIVSVWSRDILKKLNYDEHICELAAIAGYLHDIGNVVNREDHGRLSALFALEILERYNLPAEDIVTIISAIGNHEEEIGQPVNAVSAALILADKSDVHRSRVRSVSNVYLDIHDRVNYAVTNSNLNVFFEKKVISLNLEIDTKIAQILEYFEIFMSRLEICRRAARFLNCSYELIINNQKVV